MTKGFNSLRVLGKVRSVLFGLYLSLFFGMLLIASYFGFTTGILGVAFHGTEQSPTFEVLFLLLKVFISWLRLGLITFVVFLLWVISELGCVVSGTNKFLKEEKKKKFVDEIVKELKKRGFKS